MAARWNGCSACPLVHAFFPLPLLACFLPSSLACLHPPSCVILLCACTVHVSDSPAGRPVTWTQGESDGATQKVEEKQHSSCALSHFVLLLQWRLAGQGEREAGLMEEEEKMKLHLFWWLTNDFEMRVDLARRQNHFPNNTAWSLNKQNWDAARTWRGDGPLCGDTNNPSQRGGCVCVFKHDHGLKDTAEVNNRPRLGDGGRHARLQPVRSDSHTSWMDNQHRFWWSLIRSDCCHMVTVHSLNNICCVLAHTFLKCTHT